MRRSQWKGTYVKLKNAKDSSLETSPIKVSRNSLITPKLVEKNCKIHNGKNFKEILTTKEMIGHKFGEFHKTRADFEFKKKRKK
jgi:ribosomal protein S19